MPLVLRALALSRVILAREAAGDKPQFAGRKVWSRVFLGGRREPGSSVAHRLRRAKGPTQPPQVFQFVHEIVTAMAGHFPELSLHLFLEAAVGADRAGFAAIAYAFVSEAFILYEDELPDSRAQIKALHAMIGCLAASRGCEPNDYDALVTKTSLYSAKLFKKPDQCRAIAKVRCPPTPAARPPKLPAPPFALLSL